MYGQLTTDELFAIRLTDIIFALVADLELGIEKAVEVVETAKEFESVITKRDASSIVVNTSHPSTGKQLKLKVFVTLSGVNLKGHYQDRPRFSRIFCESRNEGNDHAPNNQ